MNISKLAGLFLMSALISACGGSLHKSIIVKSEEDVIREIKHSTKVNKRDWHGEAPLHLAAWRGLIKPVEALVERGADINAHDFSGRTPFMISLRAGHTEVAQYLLDAGTELDSNYRYANPLADAATSNSTGMVGKLISLGIKVDRTNKEGESALHVAAGYGHVDTVRLLLDSGADKNMQTASGWTPLLSAALNSHHEVIDILLDAGAQLQTADTSEYHAKATGVLYEHIANSSGSSVLQREKLEIAAMHYAASARLFDVKVSMLDEEINQTKIKNIALFAFGVAAARAMPGTTIPTSSGGLVTVTPPVYVSMHSVKSVSDLKKLLQKEHSEMIAAHDRCAGKAVSL